MRLTCFATNTDSEAIAALELSHRQRARAEDRIHAARATGLRNLALTGLARLSEPRRLRLRLFSTAAQLVTTGRRYLRLARRWPWTDVITDALDRLQAFRSVRACTWAEASGRRHGGGQGDQEVSLLMPWHGGPEGADWFAA